MDKLEEIKNKISAFQAKSAAKDEIQAFITLVISLLKKYREGFDSISSDNIATIGEIIKKIEKQNADIVSNVNSTTDRAIKDFNKRLKGVKDLLDEIKSIEVTNGVDGKDADEEKIVEEVLSKIKLPEYKETVLDGGAEIVIKINELDTDDEELKIDASHIKNLPEMARDISHEMVRTGMGNVEVYSSTGRVGSSQRLRFTGATLTTDPDGAIKIAITGGVGGGHTIEDEGTPLTTRSKLNFVGAGVTVTDDSGDDATVVTIPGGGSITGTDTQVLFFDGNNNPAGDNGLTYNKTTDTVSLINIRNISGNTLSIATLNAASPSPINVESGNATAGNTAGAHLLLRSGEGFGSGAGGVLYLAGNTGGLTGDGGGVQLSAGGGGATSGNGADVTITAGSAQAGDGNGGNIILTTGDPDGAGAVGTLNIVDSSLATANNGYVWTLTNDVTGAGAWTLNSSIELETNGTPNGDQTLLNLKDGANISVTDNGVGGITIAATGLVPYTGATSDVDLGLFGLEATEIRANSSAGLLVEANNGTDVGILGVGNTANVEWYGSHNFSGATQDTIAAFTGAGKTLGSLALATYPSLTELSYVKGVTSAIQTQLNAKLASSDYDDATAAETNTGTSTTKYVSPDGLAGSDYGKRVVSILVSDPLGSAITTGDGKACFRVPSVMNGWNLVGVAGSLSTVSSSGLPTFQVRRSRRSTATTRSDADMLSTKLSIDASEFDSVDATTAVVIDTANDDVNTGDNIYIDIDVAGTGAKGLVAELIFQLP